LRKKIYVIRQGHGPFLFYVAVRQIDKLEPGLVGAEHAIRLCHLADLAAVTIDRIGRVDQFAYLRRVLKTAAQILPVIPPGTDDDRIFLAPFGVKIRELGFRLF
jgi:hypothetical protein